MKQHILTAIRTTLVLLVLVSVVYPVLVWGIGQLAFRGQANGSLIVRQGRVVGSSLIGQSFASDRYFLSRPSAIDYNASASGGSNLGPTSRKLHDQIAQRNAAVSAAGPAASRRREGRRDGARPAGEDAGVPADAVTASGSGLDPHISPANALRQVPRVARGRGLEETRVHALVGQHVEGRFLGVFGEPRVNVLLLNLALDDMMKR